VTTPVLASMAKRPPALSVNEYVTVLGGGVGVAGGAVTPTAVPLAAFSSTALAAGLSSAGAITLNSSTSFTLIVNMVSAVEPSAEWPAP